MEWLKKLGNLNRQWVYLLLLLSIAVPMFLPLGLPVDIAKETKAAFDIIDKMKPGQRLWISYDYGFSNKAEVYPQSEAVIRHAFKKGLVVYAYALWEEGGMFGPDQVQNIAKEMGKQDGVDYVLLGWRAQATTQLRLATNDLLSAMTGIDTQGKPLADMPAMKGVKSLKDIDTFVSFASGSPGYPDYITYVTSPAVLNKPLITGTVAVQIAGSMSSLRTGFLKGVIGGSKGAAEYESMVGYKGKGQGSYDAQNLAQGLVLLLIIVGNVSYFLSRDDKIR